MSPRNTHHGVGPEVFANLFMDIARAYHASKKRLGDKAMAARRIRGIERLAVRAGYTDRDVLPILARLR